MNSWKIEADKDKCEYKGNGGCNHFENECIVMDSSFYALARCMEGCCPLKIDD